MLTDVKTASVGLLFVPISKLEIIFTIEKYQSNELGFPRGKRLCDRKLTLLPSEN